MLLLTFEFLRSLPMRRRSASRFVPALLLGLLLAVPPADARQLVEPGDALVATGSTIYVVRGDGGGVDVLTPRNVLDPNFLVKARGVVVDPDRERVFVVTNQSTDASILMIDPDTGGQTVLRDGFGAPLVFSGPGSGLDISREGELIMTTNTGQQVSYLGALERITTPSGNGSAAKLGSMLLGGAPGSGFGLSVTQEEAAAPLRILISKISTEQPLYAIDYVAKTLTPVPGTPVQSGDILFIPDLEYNCVKLTSVPLCVRYWLEARVNISGQCVSADAAIFQYNYLFNETSTLFLGPPLRCPVAIALVPGGDLMVLDSTLAGIGGNATSLRLYRFTKVGEAWVPTLLASESELVDTGSKMAPGLAVSSVALPEPGAASVGLTSLAVLALTSRSRARRGSGRDGSAAAGSARRVSRRVPAA